MSDRLEELRARLELARQPYGGTEFDLGPNPSCSEPIDLMSPARCREVAALFGYELAAPGADARVGCYRKSGRGTWEDDSWKRSGGPRTDEWMSRCALMDAAVRDGRSSAVDWIGRLVDSPEGMRVWLGALDDPQRSEHDFWAALAKVVKSGELGERS